MVKKPLAFAEDQGSIPSTHMTAHNCNSSSSRSDALTQMYMQAKHPYTLKKNFFLISFKKNC